MTESSANPHLIKSAHISFGSRLPSLSSIIAYGFIIWLIYAFLSGITLKFYASVLFFFYSFINRMWISVICLGIFQTLLLIPFRIVKVKHSQHIKEFVDNISNIKDVKVQASQYKQEISKGRKAGLFYSVDFFVQLVSYTSIGRLFLTDFYSNYINPDLLYSFVKYPQYPILDRFFKIPYPYFTSTVDFGLKPVLIAWLIIFILILALRLAQYFSKRNQEKNPAQERMSLFYAKISSQILLFGVLAWIIIRHFPTSWEMRIFQGDISIPNPSLNTITALVTFGTLMWFGVNNMYRKSKLARENNMPQSVIDKTEQEMFKSMIVSSGIIGLGAYFITNQIPSAFELSIFTLEIISLLSPLTLDKVITAHVPIKN